MRRTHRIILAATLAATPLAAALAQDHGYVGPGSEPSGTTTVGAVMAARDGTDVVLHGRIVRQIDEDHYLFDDGTGQVTVKIKRGEWKKATADAGTPVELKGEVDVDHKLVSVDVDKVRVLAARR